MIELLIALFAILLLTVGFFIKRKGPSVFILNGEAISAEHARRNLLFFKQSSSVFILMGLLCLFSVFVKSTLLYALLLFLATILTAIFSTRLAALLKEQSR